MGQTRSEQSTEASLIRILGPEPSAEHSEEGTDCLKIGGLLRIGWTPLKDWPGACATQGAGANESEQCTGAC
jgi:hypothetical protein